MRIIAGLFKSRQFKAPKGRRTHPMSERGRAAMFNILGDISGLTMLDAFGGSGAIGFEAVSRGASFVQCVDSDKRAYQTIADNAEKLGFGDKFKVTKANVSSWADNNRDKQFDIVVCDPPYDDLRVNILQKLADHVADKGLMILSWPVAELEVPEFTGLKLTEKRQYAGLSMVFYRRTR
jgi:16S rRNA (guanine966-N2)-methyltransferase